LRDFSGMLIEWFTNEGFIYHAKTTIWKNPVTEMQRTKALGLLHKTIKKDSVMSRVGIPDYVLFFRNEGDNLIQQSLDLEIDTKNISMIGVSGTFTSIASIYLGQKIYNEEEIHLTTLNNSWIQDLSSQLNQMTEAQIISSYPSLDPKRAKTLSTGVLIVCNIMKKFKFQELKVSKSDILEGLILKNY